MKKNMLILAFVALIAGGANAGFIDARTAPASGTGRGNDAAAEVSGSRHQSAGSATQADVTTRDSSGKVGAETTQIVHGKRNLVLQPGMRLSHAIREWLQPQAIRLSWEAQGSAPGLIRDFEVETPWMSSTTDLEGVLTEVLGSFGFTAELIRSAGASAGTAEVVVVRNATTIRP